MIVRSHRPAGDEDVHNCCPPRRMSKTELAGGSVRSGELSRSACKAFLPLTTRVLESPPTTDPSQQWLRSTDR